VRLSHRCWSVIRPLVYGSWATSADSIPSDIRIRARVARRLPQ
jgi:hypothetical protein